jgi:transcriptional regulator with XRE-family HTH domain
MERITLRDEIKKAFGESLLKQRRQASETLEGVATKGDMTLRYVQDVEAGNKLPSILTLVKLCDALNITPDKLLLPVLNHYKKLKKTRK